MDSTAKATAFLILTALPNDDFSPEALWNSLRTSARQRDLLTSLLSSFCKQSRSDRVHSLPLSYGPAQYIGAANAMILFCDSMFTDHRLSWDAKAIGMKVCQIYTSPMSLQSSVEVDISIETVKHYTPGDPPAKLQSGVEVGTNLIDTGDSMQSSKSGHESAELGTSAAQLVKAPMRSAQSSSMQPSTTKQNAVSLDSRPSPYILPPGSSSTACMVTLVNRSFDGRLTTYVKVEEFIKGIKVHEWASPANPFIVSDQMNIKQHLTAEQLNSIIWFDCSNAAKIDHAERHGTMHDLFAQKLQENQQKAHQVQREQAQQNAQQNAPASKAEMKFRTFDPAMPTDRAAKKVYTAAIKAAEPPKKRVRKKKGVDPEESPSKRSKKNHTS